MKRNSYISALALMIICVLLFLPGCGSRLYWISIAYQPQTDYSADMPAYNKVNLYVDEFTDVRGGPDSNVVGQAKTGMFNKATPIVIGADIERLAVSAFRQAFSEAGFNVVKELDKADLVFKGRINIFWVQEYATGWAPEYSEADVELDVVMIDKVRGENIWFDIKRSHAVTKQNMIDVSAENEQIINQAFNKVVSTIVEDSELAEAVNEFISSRK